MLVEYLQHPSLLLWQSQTLDAVGQANTGIRNKHPRGWRLFVILYRQVLPNQDNRRYSPENRQIYFNVNHLKYSEVCRPRKYLVLNKFNFAQRFGWVSAMIFCKSQL